MARPIVLSNGELHVGLNKFAMVHDFYYPFVGFENHCAGDALRHKIGVWVDNEFSWLYDHTWNIKFQYPHDALVGHAVASNDKLGLIIEFDDFVDAKVSAFIRNIHVINQCDRQREVRIFMYQAFAIGDSRSNTDTAQYLPDSNAILHYRGRRAFIISGEYNKKPFDQHTVGLFGIEGREGTYRDAEDGSLCNNDVEHGRVDSTIRFSLNITANNSARIYYWIAAGTSTREALYIHKLIQRDSPQIRLNSTVDWWQNWLKPAHNVASKIEPQFRKIFIQSVMTIKSQIDKRGAIIASTDTSMLNYSRDAYSYCWPRDGAYALWPFIRMGYTDEAHRFFQFIRRSLDTDGYLMHKFRADGALGSSWHSYVHGKTIAPPIQEDETALPLFLFAQYYQINKDSAILKEFYNDMVVPMADFLANYVDKNTGLPRPSYNIWEETFLTSTYTTAVVYAALMAASDLATTAGDPNNAVKWRVAASEIQTAAHKHLYNKNRKVFRRGLNFIDGKIIYDDTVDCSSVFGSYIFGLFHINSEEIKTSIETVKQLFGINSGAIGLPRYEGDLYRRSSDSIKGNLWFITSFWLAQTYIDNNERDKAIKILDWAQHNAMDTGMMGEQFDPVSGSVVAPAPLTWTHAEFISTLLDLAMIEDE